MKKVVLGVLLFAVCAGGLAYAAGLIKFDAGVNAGTCQLDSEINPTLRAKIDQTATKFVQAILEPNAEAALALMTNEARGSLTADKFSADLQLMLRASAPFADTKVSHTYFVQSSGTGPETRTVCGTLAGNGWVSVAVRPGLPQAHVVITSGARNNDWAFTLWLLPSGDDWQVQYFHMGASTIVGMTPEMLLASAREERDSGHPFNAAMLYAGVQGTIDRGNSFQLGIAQTLRDDLGKFTVPVEISGKPPFVWDMRGEKYSVSQASIIGVQGKLGLVFLLPQSTWGGEQDANTKNRAFINSFIATHPDYSRSFKFLVARALKPDNSGGFGTVYESDKGFD
jgi:hypothetical protein